MSITLVADKPALSVVSPITVPADDVLGSGIHLAQYAQAERMEAGLGDPEHPNNLLSFRNALAADESEQLPYDGLAALRRLGWQQYCVPTALGGRMRSCEELLTLARVLARRDMNVAVSESTQLWTMLAWIGCDDQQRRRLADAMILGDVIPCLAYSEASHGADLLANDFVADGDGDHYLLTGKKWPINRAVSSTHVVLLARTSSARTARDQSLFLVEKEQLDPSRISELPRVATYGLRGCDISGIGFDGARIPATARVGAEGEGLELALRGLLLTRTLCTGLSLGVADTMLRVVGGYLADRRLYGAPASDIPHVRETLANSYLSLLVAECASTVAMRGLHLFPEEFSSWSSLAKVQVTRLVDHSAQALARTLGARYYMRGEGEQGIFQKMLRDSAIVSVFDGSEPVCLDSLAGQLAVMARARRTPREENWAVLYDLRAPLEDFRPERMKVFGRGRDAVFASLPALRHGLAEATPTAGCGQDRLESLRAAGTQLQQRVDDLFEGVRAASAPAAGSRSVAASGSAKNTPARLVRLAALCCALHADVTCLGIWLHNRDHLGAFFADGEWLEAALARTPGRQFDVGDLAPPVAGRLFAQMTRQRENSQFFSILPLKQAAPFEIEAIPA